MAVPERIPIAHEPGYRTDTIGRYDHGQFFASITWAAPEGTDFPADDWAEHKRRYVVLHRFDHDGRYVDSDIRAFGTWAERASPANGIFLVPDPAEVALAELLDALPGRRYGDIAIRPFRVVVDGVLFGLVIERHHEPGDEDDWAELYPDQLGFSAPWDGCYDT